jgi:hypothetical protein
VKGLSDETLFEIEETAREGSRQIRKYFAYQGDNPVYHQKAKIGGVAMSSHSRLVATQTNRVSLAIAISKAIGLNGDETMGLLGDLGCAPKRITSGDDK